MSHRKIKLATKIKVYTAVILTQSLLYGYETWTLYRKHIKQFKCFHMRSLKSIICIKWQDRVTNIEVLDRSGLTRTETMILRAQLHLTVNVIGMDSSNISCQLFYGVPVQGHRNRGHPRRHYSDCIKEFQTCLHLSRRAATLCPGQNSLACSDKENIHQHWAQ